MLFIIFIAAIVLALAYGIPKALSFIKVSATERAVLITGCDTGFGRMTSETLARSGTLVFAGCLTDAGVEELEALNSEFTSGGRIKAFIMNVTSEESVAESFEVVKKEIPATGLWAIINNAGVLRAGNLDTLPIAHWKLQLDVNVLGIAIVTKTFMSLLRKCKNSRIINIASVAGRLGTPGTSAYNASKFAVEGLSDAWRRELAMWDINVSIVEPGIMRTPLWDAPLTNSEIDNVWGNVSKEVQDLYGRQYFIDSHNAGKELVDKINGNPQQVVDTLVQATLAAYPQHRYPVGMDAPLWIFLSSLPSWLCDRLLKLAVKQPVPAALK